MTVGTPVGRFFGTTVGKSSKGGHPPRDGWSRSGAVESFEPVVGGNDPVLV